MSPEEQILQTVKSTIESDTELLAALGAVPDTQYWNQEENENPPYFTYKMTDAKQVDTNSVYEGYLEVDLWFYATNASQASEVEDILVSIFDKKTIYDTKVMCRLFHDTEERRGAPINRIVSNPGVNEQDAIHKCIRWYCRWTAINRGYKKI